MQFPFRRVVPTRPRPVVPLRVFNGTKLVQLFAVVDTGADNVILPNHLLPLLGLRRTRGIAAPIRGAGASFRVLFYDVELELHAGPTDRLRWRARVGFGPTPAHLGLFGVAGGLEFFHTSVAFTDERFGLTPHPLLPLVPPTAFPHAPIPVP